MFFENDCPTVCLCCNNNGVIVDSDCPEFGLMRCSECGYELYSSTNVIQANHYEDSDQYVHYHDNNPRLSWHHDNAIKQLLALELGPGSRVLDFGCFDGFLVKRLCDLGFDAYGVDWNRDALSGGVSTYGLEGRLGTEMDEKFSVVLAMEVIEHFQVPSDFFDVINSYIEAGGVLILSCPSSKAIYRPLADFPPHHFSRFTPKCLSLLVKQQGYQILDHREQMSVTQWLRNWFGDRLRRSRQVATEESSMNLSTTSSFRFLRRAFNTVSAQLEWGLTPLNYSLKKMGVRYIGQLVVARKIVQ